jgi:diguanylate cyclase (GGDEF)-like protein
MVEVAVVVLAALIAGLATWRFALRSRTRVEERMAAEREQLEALALEDPLTGLPNKRALDRRVDGELARAGREYYPLAIVAVDIDGFKQINERWGAAVGDDALAKVARHISAELRGGDICGRVGDDKFMIALVRADAVSAERVVARLRAALEFVTVGPADELVRFSAGIAEFPRDGVARSELVACADAALRAAKSNGRGRTTVYSPGPGDRRSTRRSHDGFQQRSLLSTLQTLAKAVDAKNRYTHGHSERVATYAAALAKSFGFDEERLVALRQAALLHDVGKIGIRETILTKEMPLNLEEIEEMQRHSELGRAMIAGAGMPEIARWVNHLHERFDGEGYPDRLAGREIPVESRILHVADAIDQMARPSALRRERPHREVLAELSYSAGTRVDPEIAARAIELVHSGDLKIADLTSKPRNRTLSAPAA